MHTRSVVVAADPKALIPNWRQLVEEQFERRHVPDTRVEISEDRRGARVSLHHEPCTGSPCVWDGVAEQAAFDAAEALRRAWTSRNDLPAENHFVVFYSWQSHSPKTNRNLIEDALKRTVASIRKDELELVPVIDRDTAGVPGSPDISSAIFAKIERASLFVADVSITLRDKDRCSPNPNVLVELGYAAHALGWDRIVLVLNEDLGGVEELPFDLRSHRTLRYSMAAGDKPANARNNLTSSLETTIRSAMARGNRQLAEPTLRDRLRKLLHEVSQANGSSYAPVMLTSTIRYPGVSREEYARRLRDSLAVMPPQFSVELPDPRKKLTGPCEGEIIQFAAVGDEHIELALPPLGTTFRVPLSKVTHVWRHSHCLVGMTLGATVVVPEGRSGELIRLGDN